MSEQQASQSQPSQGQSGEPGAYERCLCRELLDHLRAHFHISPEVKQHFLKVMSSRAAEMLNEDIEVLGAMRARDITQAQQDVVLAARNLEAEGKIILKNEGEDNDA